MYIKTEPKGWNMFAVFMYFKEDGPDEEDVEIKGYLQEHKLMPKQRTKTTVEDDECEVWYFGGCYLRNHLQEIMAIQRRVVTREMLAKRPEMIEDGFRKGDLVKGSVLMARYSRYMQQFSEEMRKEIEVNGCRFTHHTSIAPTGTISLSLANNASNGIEPSFAHRYSRNVIREGKKTKEKVDVYSYELLAYRHLVNPAAVPFGENENERLPDYFITSEDVTPKQHVDIQSAAQKWIDSSISKTANVSTDFPFEEFQDIYRYAWEKGLKGCTTFRFNPEVFQGVLVKEEDLKNTKYQFTLENGDVVEVRGNEEIEYDGELHTAANLFDALKEGYYGRF